MNSIGHMKNQMFGGRFQMQMFLVCIQKNWHIHGCIWMRIGSFSSSTQWMMDVFFLTFTISALLAPQETKTACRQFCMTGNVRVILCGGGLGESLMAATHALSSCKQHFHVTFSYNFPTNKVQILNCSWFLLLQCSYFYERSCVMVLCYNTPTALLYVHICHEAAYICRDVAYICWEVAHVMR